MYRSPDGSTVLLCPPRTGSRSVQTLAGLNGWTVVAGHHHIDVDACRAARRVILFVRHPLDTLVSWYTQAPQMAERHKRLRVWVDFWYPQDVGQTGIGTYLYPAPNGCVSFFAPYLEHATEILRFEDGHDANLRRVFGGDAHETDAGSTRAGRDWRSFYSPEDAAYVAGLFAPDMDALGYGL